MKKAVLIVLPLLLVVGVVVGLSAMGIVNVPFLPFGKKRIVKVPPDDGKGGPFAPLALAFAAGSKQAELAKEREAATIPSPVPQSAVDPGPGEAKLAGLWSSMPTDRVVALVNRWPEKELGRILAKMDEEAAAKLLADLPALRAASLSRALARAADEKAAQSMKKDSQ